MKIQSKAICILGSGRCGTSMITRAINYLGVDLGSDIYSDGDRTNPKGYWENTVILKQHQKIINRFGSPLVSQNWWKTPYAQGIKQELAKYIETNFSKKTLWGWKDPRTSECLILWKEIFKDLNISGNYLIMVRNPIDVAASFQRAYKTDGVWGQPDWALRLWQIRTLLALKETNGEKRIIIDYDQFLKSPIDCLRLISRTFNIPWPTNETEFNQQLDEFVDLRLQHIKSGIQHLMEQKNIDNDIKLLYRLCSKATQSQQFLNSESFQSQVEELYQNYMSKH